MSAESAYAWGAIPADPGCWRFRLWAPGVRALTLRLPDRDVAMDAENDGWFSVLATAEEGECYRYVLPSGTEAPVPASRRQAGDVHGASRLTAPRAPALWAGRPWEETVIYELHVGTFTAEGTYRAAIGELERLVA